MSLHRAKISGPVPLIVLLCLPAVPAVAQTNMPGGNYQDHSQLSGSIPHDELERLNSNNKKNTGANASSDSVLSPAEAKAQSEVLIAKLQLPCTVSNARLVASGTRQLTPGAKEVESRVYEIACTAGMGYLLETQGQEPPIGISCLHAEELRARDAAKGDKPKLFCELPENRDVNALVASLIKSGSGAPCQVKELQWFGKSVSTQTEYSEVACQEGGGFLVQTPLPGSQGQTTVLSCADAAKRGIKCRLTDAGPVETPITMDTFREALAHNGVKCTIDELKLIGQEEKRQRYVVEYRCADQPASAVAFIPLKGNTVPYESVGCDEAAQSGVNCSLSR